MIRPPVTTPQERAILALMTAAELAGLDPVVEIPRWGPPRSVDLRVMNGAHVVAAMRVRIVDHDWMYEAPARIGGRAAHRPRTYWLRKTHTPITPRFFRPLDWWFAKIPGTGRRPGPAPAPMQGGYLDWMKPGYWETREKKQRPRF